MGNCFSFNLSQSSEVVFKIPDPAPVDEDSITRVPVVESVVSDTISDKTVDINAMSEHSIDTASVVQINEQVIQTINSIPEVVDSNVSENVEEEKFKEESADL